MIDWIIKKLTNNYKKIPLCSIYIDGEKLKDSGSAEIIIHPSLKDNVVLKCIINKVIKYIRNIIMRRALYERL